MKVSTLRPCLLLAAIAAVAVSTSRANAQCCTPVVTYRWQCQTVYEERQSTAYRIEYETVVEQQPVTVHRNVVETEMRERRYRVAKPVIETSTREERYCVEKPVWETQEREVRRVVQKPVYETAERVEQYTVYRPVTTYRCQTVDQGCYETQQVLKPGACVTRLRWMPGGWAVDEATGVQVRRIAGFRWVQERTPDTYESYRVWRPNLVQVQVPQTVMMPQVETRKVPIQTVRYEQVEEVHKVPVQVCRMVRQEMVRKVPVQTQRIQYEDRVEQVPVQVCRRVTTQETREVRRVVAKRVPVTCTYRVPHTTWRLVPVDPYTGEVLSSSTPVYDEGVPAPAATDQGQVGQPTPVPALERETKKPATEQPPAEQNEQAPPAEKQDNEQPDLKKIEPTNEESTSTSVGRLVKVVFPGR